MSTESKVKRLAERVAAAQAIVVAMRKQGTEAKLDQAKAEWNAVVAEYDEAVDAWSEAGFPTAGG
ncbi:hypothetical protein [Telmatospirillum sp.]|uniref:hypothetical protein n=1 Tax=Telmatospirillum sp. TaxID=2079197 RepID=UPI00284DBC47|nr:hypothetical protein [Telmatospirillum sp.]MDR3438732.1 hypothetical protein [Telmatospirillum sp.]